MKKSTLVSMFMLTCGLSSLQAQVTIQAHHVFTPGSAYVVSGFIGKPFGLFS